jgi:sulfhydrogenase subunit alpha
MTRTITIDHLPRVEGHGGIWVELEGNAVKEVQFRIFEGLRLVEGLVRERDFNDVPQIVSRICAICSVAHTLTSIKAIEDAFAVQPGPQTLQLRDLMFRGENIESHALHLFLLALPDYFGYPSAADMAVEHREAVTLGLRLKRLGNSIQETIGGRAIHPVNALVGGFGSLPTADQLIALRNELRIGVEDSEAIVDVIRSLPPVDYCQADTVYAAMRSEPVYGYYEGDCVEIVEKQSRERFAPAAYHTVIDERAMPYSHAKLSEHKGTPFMVGALARLAVNGERLDGIGGRALSELRLRLPSGNPMDNNKAQAVELVFDIEQALFAVERLLGGTLAREARPALRPRAARGSAVTEAPRGLLVHSYEFDGNGRVVAADVVTPTAINAASIERHIGRAIEQSAERDIPTLTRKAEMIARAYDPCISCSVHLVCGRDGD